MISEEPLTILTLDLHRSWPGSLILVVVDSVGIALGILSAVIPVDAADGFSEVQHTTRDVLGQQLYHSDEATRDDVVSARDLCPLSELTQGHFIHAGGAALTAFHLRQKQQQKMFT